MSEKRKQGRHVSRAGRAAMAASGLENLRRWREGQVAESVKVAREKVAAFDAKLRTEFPDPPAIVEALIESAVASFTSLILVTCKQSIGSSRIDRLERTHALLVEVQRVLFRTVRALSAYAESPEARDAALRRLSAAIPSQTEEQRQAAADANAARIKAEVAAANTKFAWLAPGADPDARPDGC